VRLSGISVIFVCGIAFAAVRSPDDRAVTDPQSVTSDAKPGTDPVSIESLFYTRTVTDPAWSPDGRTILFSSNLTGRLNLWKVPSSGGWPIQLSESNDRQFGGTWSPDGKWIVFQQDFGGGELFDLFAVPGGGGDPINLTRTPDISESDARWSPKGDLLAISYRPKTASSVDVALLNWSTREVRNLTNEQDKTRSWYGAIWSPNGRTIYATRSNAGGTDSDVYQVDVSSGRIENLTPHKGERLYSVSSVSPDGLSLLITSNEKGGYDNVALLDTGARKLTWATDLKWEADAGDFSPSGKSFSYTVNEDGRRNVFIVDRKSGQTEKMRLPDGLNSATGTPTAFAPAADKILVSHQSSNEPADLWVYDLHARHAQQLTYSAPASLSSSRLPPSQLVHYRTFDGKIISAFLWVPFNLKRDGSNPGVVLPHGGPTGQTIDLFNRTAAALASNGYVAIAPNVRGSTGYGMEFQKANYKDIGGGDLQDEVYAARFLIDTGFVDAKKIGITGGSYGGYMAMMAIGKTPDVWAAAVELFGITDWLTEQEHEDPTLQQYDQSILGDPVKDRKVYEDASPIKYFRNARAPLLVLQGANDIRDPSEEAEQAVAVLKKEGKVVDAHYYPDEGHGFAKRENQIDSIRRTLDWFQRYLKGNSP
jgi:dipeptidyl aminopeptidase/acylaminoacyl peptidase